MHTKTSSNDVLEDTLLQHPNSSKAIIFAQSWQYNADFLFENNVDEP